MSAPPAVGLYGKLPARGDFVRLGLPADFVAPWDDWLQHALFHGRAGLDEARWRAGWAAAPTWHFALAPGLCGAAPMCGILMPSGDRVGRCFPLTIAAMACGDAAPRSAPAWFAACAAAGRAAVRDAAEPADVMARLATLPPAPGGAPAAGSVWWCEDGRHKEGGHPSLSLAGLPDATTCMDTLYGGAFRREATPTP